MQEEHAAEKAQKTGTWRSCKIEGESDLPSHISEKRKKEEGGAEESGRKESERRGRDE